MLVEGSQLDQHSAMATMERNNTSFREGVRETMPEGKYMYSPSQNSDVQHQGCIQRGSDSILQSLGLFKLNRI